MARQRWILCLLALVAAGVAPGSASAQGVVVPGSLTLLSDSPAPGSLRVTGVGTVAETGTGLWLSWDYQRTDCPMSVSDLPEEGGWLIGGNNSSETLSAGPLSVWAVVRPPALRVRVCAYFDDPAYGGLAASAVMDVPPPASRATRAAEPAWRKAAARARMRVQRPTWTPALTLKRVGYQRGICGPGHEQVFATYNGPGGDLLRIGAGRPYICGDLGDVKLLGTSYVGGRKAWFYESPNSGNEGGMILTWFTEARRQRARGPGNEMYLEVRGRDMARALRIARSLRTVSP